MNTQILFGTPFWSKKLTDDNEFNLSLLKEGLNYQGGNYFDLPGESIAKLKDEVSKEITEIIKIHKPSYNSIKFEARQNPIEPLQDDSPHFHPERFLVAVYYVRVPESSGDLLLHDPRGSVNWNDNQIISDNIKLGRTFYKVSPIEGTLVIFPGYLIHSVTTNLSNDVRVSIAINIIVE